MIIELGFYGGKSGRALAAAVEFELQSVKIRCVWIKFSLYAFL